MAVPTISEIIPIAELSQTYAVNDIYKRGLFGGGVDANLARKIYCVRKNVDFMYNIDPTYSTLDGCGKFLYAICSPYSAKAATTLANAQGGGGTSVVVPNGNNYAWYSLVTTFGDETIDINDTAFFARGVLVDAISVNVMVVNSQTKTLPPDFTFDSAAGEVDYGSNRFFTGDIIAMQFYRKIS